MEKYGKHAWFKQLEMARNRIHSMPEDDAKKLLENLLNELETCYEDMHDHHVLQDRHPCISAMYLLFVKIKTGEFHESK